MGKEIREWVGQGWSLIDIVEKLRADGYGKEQAWQMIDQVDLSDAMHFLYASVSRT